MSAGRRGLPQHHGAVDYPDVRERLREITELTFCLQIVFLSEQSDIVAEIQ